MTFLLLKTGNYVSRSFMSKNVFSRQDRLGCSRQPGKRNPEKLRQVKLLVYRQLRIAALVTPGLASARSQLPISQTPVQYGDHYYQVFDRDAGIEWNDAKTQCEALGGYLVIINDAEENAFLTSIGAGNRSFHLGASDAENEGDWRWVDGSPMTYQNWDKGEPSEGQNSTALAENYLNAFSAQWPKWSSGRSRAMGFICEWDRLPEANAEQ